jgi:hypothetical protein
VRLWRGEQGTWRADRKARKKETEGNVNFFGSARENRGHDEVEDDSNGFDEKWARRDFMDRVDRRQFRSMLGPGLARWIGQ